jgi:hypothetical protein
MTRHITSLTNVFSKKLENLQAAAAPDYDRGRD